jgi:hypothetical protein
MRLESGYTPRPYYGTGAGSLTADPALKDITKSFGGGEAFDFNSGNKASGMFDPVTLGLGLGSSVISGLFGMGQAKTSASIAQGQLDAHKYGLKAAADANKGQLAGALFNKLFDVGSGGDISFQREKDAKMFEVGPYAERLMGLNSESAKRERLAAISPESKERARFENRLAIDREIAARRAQTDAMFGPISSSYLG